MATSANKNPKPIQKSTSNASGGEADGADASTRNKGGKRGKLILVIVILLLLLGGAGGGAWYFLHNNAYDSEDMGQSGDHAKGLKGKGTSAKTASTKPPVFVPLDPFTVNLQHDDTNPQYLQVGLAIKVSESSVGDAIKQRTPEIRNRVLLLLSGKKASEIATLEGKKTLSEELVREISTPLAGSVHPDAVEAVLFTSFVIQ